MAGPAEIRSYAGTDLGVPPDLLGPTQRIYLRPDGSYSTEINLTVTDPRLNQGRPTNTAALSENQIGVGGMLRQRRPHPSRKQENIAVRDAIARQQAGGDVPSYDDVDAALMAEYAHHAQVEGTGDYLSRIGPDTPYRTEAYLGRRPPL